MMENIKVLDANKRLAKLELEGRLNELNMEKMIGKDEQRTRDAKYFIANYRTLQEQFPDEWLAIWHEEVVGHNKNYRELLMKLSKQERTRGEYIERTYVRDKPPVFIFPAA